MEAVGVAGGEEEVFYYRKSPTSVVFFGGRNIQYLKISTSFSAAPTVYK